MDGFMDGWWRNLQRWHGSKNMRSCHRKSIRGASGRRSALLSSLLRGIKDMGEAEAL